MRRITTDQKWRCKYSDKAKATFNRLRDPERLGIAWGHNSDTELVQVRWDGAKDTQTFHASFIERATVNQDKPE